MSAKKTKIILGDSTKVLKTLDSDSIDLTVTSPPYDDLRTYGTDSAWNQKVFKKIAKQLYRVTKEGGTVCWNTQDMSIKGVQGGGGLSLNSFRQCIYFQKIGFKVCDIIIWDKGSTANVGALKVKYAPVYEYVFILSKGKQKTFNPIKDKTNKRAGSESVSTVRSQDGKMRKNKNRIVKSFGQRHNIWRLPGEKTKICSEHPARFPVHFVRDLLLSYSNKGDLVLDPFLGSGTSAVAARIMKRKFIGIEYSEVYYDMAKNRMKNWREEKEILKKRDERFIKENGTVLIV